MLEKFNIRVTGRAQAIQAAKSYQALLLLKAGVEEASLFLGGEGGKNLLPLANAAGFWSALSQVQR